MRDRDAFYICLNVLLVIMFSTAIVLTEDHGNSTHVCWPVCH